MHIIKGLSSLSLRVLTGPLFRAASRSRASILGAILVALLIAWCQGCVPSGQRNEDVSQSRSGPTRSGTPEEQPETKTADVPTPVRAPSSTPPVQTDKHKPQRLTRFPETPSRSSAASSERSRTEITVEKLPGYQVPAEYLFIPSSHCPEATVAVMLPADYDKEPHKKYPLIIAFGGAGECARSPEQGALAWLRYYKTDEAAKAARSGKLVAGDFRGLVTPRQLEDFNRALKRWPYTGVILACPASPPLWGFREGVDFPEYETFVMTELIPELKKRYRTDPAMIGVDGVSMGGARSLYYGLKYPGVFSSIGAVQGAFGPYMETYRQLIADNREALAHRSIQLISSDGDVMLHSVERMHKLLHDEAIPHRYRVLSGPHDYIFNQGPGALALLLFHDHALVAAARERVK